MQEDSALTICCMCLVHLQYTSVARGIYMDMSLSGYGESLELHQCQ